MVEFGIYILSITPKHLVKICYEQKHTYTQYHQYANQSIWPAV